ncbi:MAG: hypothetical protein A2289_05450 [Deltaproteobacteria bacterium RIFOXYA12_FULL_58_15]|nr:MAG: hypothetical protein A2289_05450 [Deltaproteobacteria bacterium RIFOXYA12_FULL_58_15]OGR09585.1 MAG: hypothetical protein A2341_16430 [Deltaproteobacteria bacterium RIFOXYB12_FULL_58_9]
MVIDTSALIAILHQEPEATRFAQLIEEADSLLVSPITLLEAGIIVHCRKGPDGTTELDALLDAIKPEIVAFDEEQALIARQAFERFGKGQHRAALNFGDCAVYALAATRAEPLLFKGDDFGQTDVSVVG